MYSNCKMISKTGDTLAYVSDRLMQWYLKRDLATQLSDKEFQLKFQNGGGNPQYVAESIPRENNCVSCGGTESLQRHHVVPSCFRKHFANKYKRHCSYDLVLLCEVCHTKYERVAEKEKVSLRPPHLTPQMVTNANHRIKDARTIMAWGDAIPNMALLRLWARMPHHLNSDPSRLEVFIEEQESVKAKFSNWAGEVVANLGEEYLTIFWRRHFLEHVRPAFLPQEWLDEVDQVYAKGD